MSREQLERSAERRATLAALRRRCKVAVEYIDNRELSSARAMVEYIRSELEQMQDAEPRPPRRPVLRLVPAPEAE